MSHSAACGSQAGPAGTIPVSRASGSPRSDGLLYTLAVLYLSGRWRKGRRDSLVGIESYQARQFGDNFRLPAPLIEEPAADRVREIRTRVWPCFPSSFPREVESTDYAVCSTVCVIMLRIHPPLHDALPIYHSHARSGRRTTPSAR